MINLFDSFSAWALVMDFFWASVCLLIAHILRSKIKLFQNLFFPSCLIAGLMGMLLSPNFFNVIAFSSGSGSYAGVLTAMLFATLLLGYKEKKQGVWQTVWGARDTLFGMFVMGLTQFGGAILIGYFICKAFFPELNEMVGILLPAGFYGGYGYAGSVGATLEGYGFDSAVGLGMTFATVGMLVGILVGMVCINYAIKKGYTKYAKKISDIPPEMRNGILDKAHWTSSGTATMNASAIDPVGFHWVLVFIATGGGWLLAKGINKWTGFDFPQLTTALICGGILQWLLNRTSIGPCVDKKTISHIGSIISDYLVFFGFTTIRLEVIKLYWAPLLILCIFGVLQCLWSLFWLSPRCYRSAWFERGIYRFGQFSGVAATGLTLLRVVDPDLQSGTLEDVGIASPFGSAVDMFQVNMYPVFMAMGFTFATGAAAFGAGILLMFLCKFIGCFHKPVKAGGEFERTAS